MIEAPRKKGTRKCDCGECPRCRHREREYRRFGLPKLPPRSHHRRTTLSVPSDAATLAYMAGIVDGEGTITIGSKGVRVIVGMTHFGVIEWIGENFAGTLCTRQGNGRRDLRIWTLAAQRDVQALLVALLPFLRVKDQQAREALEAINSTVRD